MVIEISMAKGCVSASFEVRRRIIIILKRVFWSFKNVGEKRNV